ncbi:MAG: divergent polysaccharide deacetylase family protein [Devosiaceae bacterium]
MAVDVGNDLHTPLLPRAAKGAALLAKIKPLVAKFTRVGGGVLGVVFVALAAWIFFTDNRLGGEPQAQSGIQVAVAPTSPAASGGSNGLAQPLPAQPGALDGQPRVLRVPTAEPADSAALDGSGPSVPQPTVPTSTDGPRLDSRGGLPALANPSLVQRFDAESFLPTLGANGERPLDVYARPLEAGTVAPGQPRVAVIVGGLGLSQTSTQEVLNRLPPAISLSFAPYGSSLTRWASRARQGGHEYLIEVPMEPFDYPNNDPGPHTLQVGLQPQANIERLHWALSRLPTPVGVVNYMGGRFASEDAALAPILGDVLGRGLMVMDDARSARNRTVQVASDSAPALRADVVIDGRADSEAINNRLAQLEATARENGSAVGVATALPLTIDMLEDWADSLAAKGIALVPVSSIVRF